MLVRWKSLATDAVWQIAVIVFVSVVLSLSVNHFRQDGLPVIGKSAEGPHSSQNGGWVESTVSLDEARALYVTNGAVFVDARPAELYGSGHIKGALNLPFDSFDESLPSIMEQAPSDSFIIVYCDGEDCPLSHDVAMQLMAKGYPNVHVLVNGWSVWHDAGLPVQATDKD